MTHRIIPYTHEARRFMEAGSVLIVREVEPQPSNVHSMEHHILEFDGSLRLFCPECHNLIPETVDYSHCDCSYPVDKMCLAKASDICPFPSAGEEVWFAEDHSFGISENPDDHGQVAFSWGMADAPRRGLHPDSPDGSENWCRRWKQVPATEMPEWAARLRGVVVSRECRRVGTITEVEAAEAGHEPLIDAGEVMEPADEVFWEWWNWELKANTRYEDDPWAWVVRVEKNCS